MKIILYGLGQGLDLVESKIKKKHEIVGYMDSFSKLSVFRGCPFYELKNVCQISYDYIVITIQERRTAWKVYEMLVHDYKLSEDCVIPFYVYANYELHDIKMRNYSLEDLQGLIFGNSHAQCGLLEKELSIPFLNLAVFRQDIYGNYKIFHQCIAGYGKRLKKLQYIIIDLYDYCCFNYDTSMGNDMADYICSGGVVDKHNFEKNGNYQKTFNELLFDVFMICERPASVFELFEDIDVRQNDICPLSRWNHIDDKRNLLAPGPIIGAVASKRYENTIRENVELLELFLKEIREFDVGIKVIFTLIPRYIAMECATETVLKSWKTEFEMIINRLCLRYNVHFWNYKSCREFSGNPMFYYDVEHMNTTGGRALTAKLNQDLKKI